MSSANEPILLVIDIGNTNVSLGVFDYRRAGGVAELAHHWRVSTHREQTSDELGVMLRALFQQDGIPIASITDIIMSSVVPPLQPIWERTTRSSRNVCSPIPRAASCGT